MTNEFEEKYGMNNEDMIQEESVEENSKDQELTMNDFKSENYIKTPEVGEDLILEVEKIVKNSKTEGVNSKTGKKFSIGLKDKNNVVRRYDVVTKNGGTVIQTAVGSPIVARVMIDNKALFGGEENGGLIFPDFQYCRDSTMSILKIMEIIATEEKSLSELISEIPHYDIFKTKVACPNNMKEIVLKQMQENIDEITPIKIDKTDGVKMYFKEGWVLVRPSGTEPIIRIYAESDNPKKAENLAFDFIEKIEKIVIQNKN